MNTQLSIINNNNNNSNLERIILDEARQISKRYHHSVAIALTMLYQQLRSAGDKPAASVTYDLIQRIEELEEEGKTTEHLV